VAEPARTVGLAAHWHGAVRTIARNVNVSSLCVLENMESKITRTPSKPVQARWGW